MKPSAVVMDSARSMACSRSRSEAVDQYGKFIKLLKNTSSSPTHSQGQGHGQRDPHIPIRILIFRVNKQLSIFCLVFCDILSCLL